MKKPLAIIILIIGSALAVFGSSLGLLAVLFILDEPGIFAVIALVFAAAFGIDCLRRLFRRKYGLNAGLFFLCVYAPSAAVSVISYIVVALLDEAGYFSGMFAGLGEFLLAISYMLSTFALVAAGGIWFAIMTAVERKRSGKPALSKPSAIVLTTVGGTVVWRVWLIASSVLWSETESLIPPLLIISGITLVIELLRQATSAAGVRAVIHYVCAYSAAVLGKAFTYYTYFDRLAADKKYGFPTDADNRFFLWYVPIEAAATAAFAVLWFALFKLVVRRKERL